MVEFAREDVVPSWFANALGKALSLLSNNFEVVKTDATHVKVPAGVNDAAAIISIGGLWRFVEADVGPIAHPGGAAGTYPAFVTAKANDISAVPVPFTDHTDYTFRLVITGPGGSPAIVPGLVDVVRHVADLVWDGAQILRVDQVTPRPLELHAARHGPGAPDALSGLTDAQFAAANKDGAANVASLRTLGPGAFQAAAGNDGRLSNTRTPTDLSVTLAKLAAALPVVIVAGVAQQVTLKSFTDFPIIGSGGSVAGFHVAGFDFPTAVLGCSVTTRWFSDPGHTAFASVGGAWVSYTGSGGLIYLDAYNPNGYYLYPECHVLAYGY